MMTQKEDWQTMLLYHPPTEAEEVLEALVNRRNQLVDMRAAEKNRLHQVHETQVESVKQLIAHFDRLIDELDKQIDDHTHTHFDGKAQVAEQIKGIGSITTACISKHPYHSNQPPATTRIDELPQLINVLRGEMSFVGPRPERPYFVEKLNQQVPYYDIRHYVKPGITGWAQVRMDYGASVEEAMEKLEYDLFYVKNHSLFLDFMVLFETIQVVLRKKGAR